MTDGMRFPEFVNWEIHSELCKERDAKWKVAKAQFLREKYGRRVHNNKDKKAARQAQNRAAEAARRVARRVASDAKRAVDKENWQLRQNVRKYAEVAKDILETQLRNTGAYSRRRQEDNRKCKSKAKSKSMKEI
jgi:hypothetical protein